MAKLKELPFSSVDDLCSGDLAPSGTARGRHPFQGPVPLLERRGAQVAIAERQQVPGHDQGGRTPGDLGDPQGCRMHGQEPHGTERMRFGGKELVSDGDEDRRPTLLRDAIGHRGESSSHEREETPAHDHRQERRVQQDLHHDPLAAGHVLARKIHLRAREFSGQ